MRKYVILLLSVLFAACQQTDTPLPTPIDLDAVAANATATTVRATEAAQPTATRVRTGPTLPPTFTPTASPIPVTEEPTPTPESLDPGRLYYIYNDDAIIALTADGSGETVVETFGAGQPMSDLTLSPNGELLAYIAPGPGSAREVFISSVDGSYRQQVSCLGFSEVHHLAWHPNGERLAFFAAQAPGDSLALYSASWIGSNNCPQGNRQIRLAVLDSASAGGVAYKPDGSAVYFSQQGLYSVNLSTGVVNGPLTPNTQQGFALKFNPVQQNLLAYLRPTVFSAPGEGNLVIFDTETGAIRYEDNTLNTHFEWSADGESMLVSTPANILLFNWSSQIATSLVNGVRIAPQAVFNPDNTRFAFLNGLADQPPQVYVMALDGRTPSQLTSHESGTIDHLIWTTGQ